jgi:hypothetical protein
MKAKQQEYKDRNERVPLWTNDLNKLTDIENIPQ